VDGDEALREALDDGVESVVLSRDMPTSDRRFVSEMLNRSHGRQWHVSDDGRVHVEEEAGAAAASSQFVALSKVLDAEELSCLVRQKLGVDVDGNAVDRSEAFEDTRPSESVVAAQAAAGEQEEEAEAAGGSAPQAAAPRSRL